jgi:hypothetical protein
MTFRGKPFWGLRTGGRAAALAAPCVLALACAPAAFASGNVVSKPPSRADRAGLLRAFNHAHRSRGNLRLVGFRVDTANSAAAYYLTLAPGGTSYATGAAELYRRTHGHSWKHVARFRNTTPFWNDVNNLGPGFLWEVTSDGAGTFDSHATSAATDGSYTSNSQTHASFSWNMTFSGGKPILFKEGYSYRAAPAFSGQYTASATTTYPADPPDSSSCTGPISQSSGVGQPGLSFATYPEFGKTKALDFSVELVSAVNWPGCSSDFDKADDSRFLVGVRMPAAVAGSHGLFDPANGLRAHPILHAEGFSYSVDNQAPSVVKESVPTQSSSENDGSVATTSNQTLKLAGTLHFKLVGLWMPLGLLGIPSPPLRADGHVPPVL